jgi:peptidoglycan DL-endopeptidase CwlO
VTDVERNSTARSSWATRRVGRVSGLVWTAVTVVIAVVVPAARPVAADQLGDARSQAAQITAEIQADAQRLDQLSQRYELAQQHVQQIDVRINASRAQLARARDRVHSDQGHLRAQAVDAYMSGTDATSLTTIFSSGGEAASAAQEYQHVANGNLSSTIDALHQDERSLAAQESKLQSDQSEAQAALQTVSADRQSAEAAEQSQEATLSSVKGKIASLVAQDQARQAAAQRASYAAKLAAAQRAAASDASSTATTGGGGTSTGAGNGGGSTTTPSPPPGGNPVPPSGSGGSAAVAAAESQIGVPYVWGGETPGVGFDCSGLTQWAWGRAGVGIPRTAQTQYGAIAHVSLAALEPGDLLFWGNGTGDIYHVAMYVGGGDVIQAPETGETVSIAPIYGNQLVGAGRP